MGRLNDENEFPTVYTCKGTCKELFTKGALFRDGYCRHCWQIVAPSRGAATFTPATEADKTRALEIVAQGYQQVSRKNRMVARLPPGMTGLEALRTVDPQLADNFLANAERMAAEQYMRCYANKENQLTLTQGEFAEFLKATGRGPTNV